MQQKLFLRLKRRNEKIQNCSRQGILCFELCVGILYVLMCNLLFHAKFNDLLMWSVFIIISAVLYFLAPNEIDLAKDRVIIKNYSKMIDEIKFDDVEEVTYLKKVKLRNLENLLLKIPFHIPFFFHYCYYKGLPCGFYAKRLNNLILLKTSESKELSSLCVWGKKKSTCYIFLGPDNPKFFYEEVKSRLKTS